MNSELNAAKGIAVGLILSLWMWILGYYVWQFGKLLWKLGSLILANGGF